MVLRFRVLILTLTLMLLASHVWSAEPEAILLVPRESELEWEPVPGAKSYEIEILDEKTSKANTFKTQESLWTGSLTPGDYLMKVRGLDKRGVPGEWSESQQFKVHLADLVRIAPVAGSKLETNLDETYETNFKWSPVPGAADYQVIIQSADGKVNRTENTKESEIKIELPVAMDYQWQVTARNGEHALDPETIRFEKFTLIGKQVATPKITKPENEFVRSMTWEAPEKVEIFKYKLEKQDPANQTWAVVDQNMKYTKNKIAFDKKWSGGDYRLTVQAFSKKRVDSKASEVKFKVRNGDRSPATEQVVTLRESIDRLSGWYGIASYLLTMVDYSGINFDKSNSQLNYSAIGGTGRIGAGYLSEKKPWGFLGVVDLSGFNVEGSGNFTFASLELNGIYRFKAGKSGEIRNQFGWFYKELPETIGPKSNSIRETNMLTSMGPHYGLEYWRALTPKLGAQANLHLYPHLMTVKTPNGESIVPTLSMQVGILGSYRLKKNMTGLMGYAYKLDRTDYKAKAGSGTATESDVNSVQVKGHYLNLFLEYEI
jgi:hypothetical protein